MRIRVTNILELLAAGADAGEILADYPYLEAGDIEAALERGAFRRAGGVTVEPRGELV